MYAIFEDGGKQYRVQKGDRLFIERRDVPEGSNSIEFDRVLMIGGGKSPRIGTPVVEGAKVVAVFDSEVKGPKIDIMKFKRRKGYKLRKGHRQQHLKVFIDEIQAGS